MFLRSVADPDPGSGAFLTLGPGKAFSGSRIPTPYFVELSDKFLGKKFYNSLKTDPNFFLQLFKNKIIFNFVKFVATKKDMTKIFFTPLICCCFGSGIRDSGAGMGKNQDPGSGINIPGPPHCTLHTVVCWRCARPDVRMHPLRCRLGLHPPPPVGMGRGESAAPEFTS